MYRAKIYWTATDENNADQRKINSLVGMAKTLPKVGQEFELDLTDLNKVLVQFGKVKSVDEHKGLIYFLSDFGNFEFLILERIGGRSNVINFPIHRKVEQSEA